MGAFGIGGEAEVRGLVRDQPAVGLEALEQAARDEAVPAVAERSIDLAQEDAVAAIDEAGRVPEGRRFPEDRPVGRGSLALRADGARCSLRWAQFARSAGLSAGVDRPPSRPSERTTRAI